MTWHFLGNSMKRHGSCLDNLTSGIRYCGSESFKIEKGLRIAQMVLCPIIKANLKEVETLDETKRGISGFGSTGVK